MRGMLGFQERFGMEDVCLKALAELRWPQSYVCARCGERRYFCYPIPNQTFNHRWMSGSFGSIPVVAAASAPSPRIPPTADIAHSGHESQLLAINGPSELAVRMSVIGRKADHRSQRPLFRQLRPLRP